MVIFEAIEKGNLKAIKKYIESGGNPNIKNDDGYSAINWAAIMGQKTIVAFLKAAGTQSDIVIEAAVGNLEGVKNFIKSGINVNELNTHGHQPLMMAAHQGHGDIVKTLIAANADVNAKHQFSGNSALFGAVHQGHREIVKLLIEAKADLNARNNENVTALMAADSAGNTDMVNLLKDAGAN